MCGGAGGGGADGPFNVEDVHDVIDVWSKFFADIEFVVDHQTRCNVSYHRSFTRGTRTKQ